MTAGQIVADIDLSGHNVVVSRGISSLELGAVRAVVLSGAAVSPSLEGTGGVYLGDCALADAVVSDAPGRVVAGDVRDERRGAEILENLALGGVGRAASCTGCGLIGAARRPRTAEAVDRRFHFGFDPF